MRACNRRSPGRWQRSGRRTTRTACCRSSWQQADRLLQQRADAEAQRAGRQAQRQLHRRWGKLTDAAGGAARADIGGEATPVPARAGDRRAPAGGGTRCRLAGDPVARARAATPGLRGELRRGGRDGARASGRRGAGRGGRDAAAARRSTPRSRRCCAARPIVSMWSTCTGRRSPRATSALARRYMPRARILYSVADLHHVRLERQAAVEERPELLAASRRVRLEECTAAWSADAVITHSAEEAELLRRAGAGGQRVSGAVGRAGARGSVARWRRGAGWRSSAAIPMRRTWTRRAGWSKR